MCRAELNIGNRAVASEAHLSLRSRSTPVGDLL